MREQVRDKGRLEHILQSIDYIFEFTKNVNFDEFETNAMLRFAVIKNLEIIGEAGYKLTVEFREKHPEVEWKLIIGLRHVLVHGYYQIENEMAWEIIQNELHPLRDKVQVIYDNI